MRVDIYNNIRVYLREANFSVSLAPSRSPPPISTYEWRPQTFKSESTAFYDFAHIIANTTDRNNTVNYNLLVLSFVIFYVFF